MTSSSTFDAAGHLFSFSFSVRRKPKHNILAIVLGIIILCLLIVTIVLIVLLVQAKAKGKSETIIWHQYCCFKLSYLRSTLLWRHNEHDSVSNHQPRGCLLNRLFRRRSKKISKLRVTGLCVGNSPGPVNSPHKGPVTRKMFPFDDVIMLTQVWWRICA